ncbi:ATP-binding response regulator [Umboniibacter marinipuniceus]|uniref:histidine kinase n=1 Tax=Umboniibacter marinipuniceus TaxID=569599 RepID=A0A3M0AK20_9GAMM|nr:response regulator [Umboniibacter marinipuniceus]RMA79402.1 PAS domain S-box-containing protein [Umboniibacter marinipuniceus]
MDHQEIEEQDCLLLVDDHPTALSMLQLVLANKPYRLVTASNGQEAIRQAKYHRPALVLLDIMMPDMDGFEVCERLKADADTADSAIIFLSAVDDSEVKVRGFNVGAVDYINKPFSGPEVVARVETHLRTKHLEDRLARQNSQLEAQNQRILESINEGIIGTDREGRITLINDAAEQMTGWANQSLMEKSVSNVFEESDRLILQQLITQGQSFASETIDMLSASQRAFPVSLSITPTRYRGEIEGAVLVFRDITEQLAQDDALNNAAEELKEQRERLAHIERLSTMGEMTAGFAHEVNQPLTAISNYARVCERFANKLDHPPERLIETLQKMEKQALRASEVIQRLRDFVKRPIDGRALYSPNELLLEIVQLAEVDARNNGVQIHLDLQFGDEQVFVDPIQIQQVALNLIRNGLEAMADSAEKDLGLWVKGIVLGDKIQVSIRDRGVGLAEGAENELFNPFYTTKKNGMGIGLSVCNTIIKDHQGHIGYRREPSGGTTFWFELPIGLAE